MGRFIRQVFLRDIQKRRVPKKHYTYVLEVDWSDGTIAQVYRRYSAFFEFQVGLLNKFPVEAGADGGRRSIPFLPGKKLIGRSHVRKVAEARIEGIAYYLDALFALPQSVSQSDFVHSFFESTDEDLNPLSEEEYLRKPEAKSVTETVSGVVTKVKKALVDDDEEEFGREMHVSGPMALEQYEAVADYKRQNKTELSLEKGDEVEVIEKDPNGWWFVVVGEEKGWAPATFLKKIAESAPPLMDGMVRLNVEGDDGGEHGQGRVWDPTQPSMYQDEKYMTTAEYTGVREDEITFGKGQEVEVLEKHANGWWLVRIRNKIGWAPSTYLKRVAMEAIITVESEVGPERPAVAPEKKRREAPQAPSAGTGAESGRRRAPTAPSSHSNGDAGTATSRGRAPTAPTPAAAAVAAAAVAEPTLSPEEAYQKWMEEQSAAAANPAANAEALMTGYYDEMGNWIQTAEDGSTGYYDGAGQWIQLTMATAAPTMPEPVAAVPEEQSAPVAKRPAKRPASRPKPTLTPRTDSVMLADAAVPTANSPRPAPKPKPTPTPTPAEDDMASKLASQWAQMGIAPDSSTTAAASSSATVPTRPAKKQSKEQMKKRRSYSEVVATTPSPTVASTPRPAPRPGTTANASRAAPPAVPSAPTALSRAPPRPETRIIPVHPAPEKMTLEQRRAAAPSAKHRPEAPAAAPTRPSKKPVSTAPKSSSSEAPVSRPSKPASSSTPKATPSVSSSSKAAPKKPPSKPDASNKPSSSRGAPPPKPTASKASPAAASDAASGWNVDITQFTNW